MSSLEDGYERFAKEYNMIDGVKLHNKLRSLTESNERYKIKNKKLTAERDKLKEALDFIVKYLSEYTCPRDFGMAPSEFCYKRTIEKKTCEPKDCFRDHFLAGSPKEGDGV